MANITTTAQNSQAVSTAKTVSGLLEKNKTAIMKTLPQGFSYDRMVRAVVNAVNTTPAVAKCTPASIFLSTVRAFSVGLEPNGITAQGYFVPFWNGKKGETECQFMPSYMGLMELARRSDRINALYATEVRDKDLFEVSNGTERKIVHKPNYREERGEAYAYYAVMVLKDGSTDFEVMTRDEVEKVRRASKASENGPWVDWYDEMAKKTVMKRLLKRAPKSVELSGAIALDNKSTMGEGQDSIDIIDVDGLNLEAEEGEPKKQTLHDKVVGKKTEAGKPEQISPSAPCDENGVPLEQK